MHSGKLEHSGEPITSGERWLLAGFVQVDHAC
jgi:hypothetical protein